MFAYVQFLLYLCSRFIKLPVYGAQNNLLIFWGKRSAIRSTIQTLSAQSCEY